MAESWLDGAALRHAAERAVRSGGEGFIGSEIARRMSDRLSYIKLIPTRIVALDAAGGTAPWRERYPQADLIRLVRVPAVRSRGTIAARLRAVFGQSAVHTVQTGLSRLPLAAASCELLWSNLALAFTPDPPATLVEWARVLAPEGLAMFSSFGPDTLKELARAFRAADALPHVHPFLDMHDVGDMLVAAGFAQPVIDMEMITLTYGDVRQLLLELRAEALTNAHRARRRGLMGRHAWQRMAEAYAALAQAGRLPASFEVVYAHAWKATPRKIADGRAIVHFDSALPRSKAV